MEVELLRHVLSPGASLVPGDHGGEQEEDGDEAEEDSRPHQKTEIAQSLVLRDAHGVEGAGGGDGTGEDPERRDAHHEPERLGKRLPCLPLLDVTGVHDDGEVGPQPHEHRPEARGGGIQVAQEKERDRQGQELSDYEGDGRVHDGAETAVAEIVEADDYQEGEGPVPDHVLLDELAILQRDDVAAAGGHLRGHGRGRASGCRSVTAFLLPSASLPRRRADEGLAGLPRRLPDVLE